MRQVSNPGISSGVTGRRVAGAAAITLSRGSILWKDGELRTVKGAGKHIDRPCFPDYWASQTKRNDLSVVGPVKR